KPALPKVVLEERRQFQKAQGVSNDRAAFAHFGGDFLLRQLKLLDQLRITLCFLDRIEILALEVLNQRQLKHGPVISFSQDDRHFGQPKQLGGAPSPFTSDKLEMAVSLPNNERLHDALLLNRIGQFAQGFCREIFSRLKRA